MARIVSLVVLVLCLIAIAILFFWLMARFLLPLFLAAVLVVIFRPVHTWLTGKCRGRERLAAGLTTGVILLAVLLPILGIVIPATFEGVAIYRALRDTYHDLQAQEALDDASPKPVVAAERRSAAVPDADRVEGDAAAGGDGNLPPLRLLAEHAAQFGKERLGLAFDPLDIERTVAGWISRGLTPVAVSTTQFLAQLALGTLVMVVALYFFLADGPQMIRQAMKLSPLDDRYEQQMVEEFGNVCRAVVMATLVSAFVQGILMGLGLYFAGFEAIFLLTVLTMLVAMIPFVGTVAVSVPSCLWLYFHENRSLAAVVLAVYALGFVANVDNFIKPWILHGRSNLHPLLALLSVLGGVQAMGPIGIFVGPMVVAFFHALLKMLPLALVEVSRVGAAKPAS